MQTVPIWMVCFCPLVCNDTCLVSTCRKLCSSRSCSTLSVVDVPVVLPRGLVQLLSRSAENCGVPQLQFSDKVVAVPVVVYDKCVCVQTVQTVWRLRRCSSCGCVRRCGHAAALSLGCLAICGSVSDSVHRADLWTFPFRSRNRYAQCKLCRVCLVMAGVVAAMRGFCLIVDAFFAPTPHPTPTNQPTNQPTNLPDPDLDWGQSLIQILPFGVLTGPSASSSSMARSCGSSASVRWSGPGRMADLDPNTDAPTPLRASSRNKGDQAQLLGLAQSPFSQRMSRAKRHDSANFTCL